MGAGKKVMIVGSYAPSLINFRGSFIGLMVRRGHQVLAVAPNIDAATAEAIRDLGATPLELPVTNQSLNPMALLGALGDLRRLVRAHSPDVIIAYTIKPVVLSAIAGRLERVPRIVSLITGAGYAFTGGRELKRLVSRAAATRLYRLALRFSDCVVFQNGDDEQLFRKARMIRPRQKVARINGSGVDVDRFAPTPLPESVSFLMISRLLKDKGIREFAAAAKRLKQARPDAAIDLVGYIDRSPDSINEAELADIEASGVTYHGAAADVRPAIAACSVYVLPSYREGTPRTVLEAMAMGRAIITTDAPGCRETVTDGVNGLLVPPRNADALYEAMERLAGDPAAVAAMGKQSRAIAEAKYDVKLVNQTLIEIAGL